MRYPAFLYVHFEKQNGENSSRMVVSPELPAFSEKKGKAQRVGLYGLEKLILVRDLTLAKPSPKPSLKPLR
jgi:hypothetical protein